MNNSERHNRFYKMIRPLARQYVRDHFCYAPSDVLLPDGPCLIMANHVTDFDPVMLAADFPRHMYFLASEHVYRMGFLSTLLRRYVAPIAKVKGSSDTKAVKDMLRALKSGYSVAFFPEGSRTFSGESDPVTEAAAKLALLSGAFLVTYRLHGGYLSTPRWAKTPRKGKTRGELVRIYKPEETRSLGIPALARAISRDLYVDAYEEQRKNPVAFKGKRLAEGLEETLYICPVCGKIGTMKGEGNRFDCNRCGFSVTMDEYGFFCGEKVSFRDVLSWDRFQKEELRKHLNDPDFFLEDSGFLLSEIRGDTETVLLSGTLRMTSSALSVEKSCSPPESVGNNSLTDSERNTSLTEPSSVPSACTNGTAHYSFSLSGLDGFAIIHKGGAESLVFTEGGTHYQLSCETNASRYKYYSFYKILTDKSGKSGIVKD